MKNSNPNTSFRRNKLSIFIAILTFISVLTCILGMVFMRYKMENVASDFMQIVERDYSNLNFVSQLKQDVYEHQSIVFHHLMEKKSEDKSALLTKANQIKENINKQAKSYEKEVKGTENEALFHQIFSDVTTYFGNVETALEFSKNNDTNTAEYYMNNTLDTSIADMNEKIQELNIIINQDIEQKRELANEKIAGVRRMTVGIIVFVVVIAAFSIVFCLRIANEMVGRDLLTGVFNFDELLKIGKRYAKRRKLSKYDGFAMDIKDFKYINQEYGSNSGDLALTTYTSYISNRLWGGEIIARNGGDNFFLLIDKHHTKSFIESIENIPVRLNDGKEIELVSRGGIYPISDGSTIRDMVNASLLALGETKKPNTEHFTWYDDSIKLKIINEKKIAESFRDAMDNGEFVVYYQPKVDLVEYKLCGCEALVRWIHEGEVVPPDKFIYIFEREGFIEELDFHVFETVCKQIKKWESMGLDVVRISSNFSKEHLKNPAFSDKIKRVIEENDVDTDYLELEFTESSIYEDVDFINNFIVDMNNMGVHVSMDDFGTAYSSLSFLRDIDMNVIKLDRSFLFHTEDYQNKKMVEDIVMMVNDLDKSIICEGVETIEQAKFLKNINCNMAQGYLFDRPLVCEDFEKRLRSPLYKTA